MSYLGERDLWGTEPGAQLPLLAPSVAATITRTDRQQTPREKAAPDPRMPESGKF